MSLPNHHDADIVIKLYDLRREGVMRASRDAITMKFWPKSFEEFEAIFSPAHPHNAAYRQVSTYWEMVYSFAKTGAVNPDLLIENAGEGLVLFAKALPYLAEIREKYNPNAFNNAEWVVSNTHVGKIKFESVQRTIQRLTAANQ